MARAIKLHHRADEGHTTAAAMQQRRDLLGQNLERLGADHAQLLFDDYCRLHCSQAQRQHCNLGADLVFVRCFTISILKGLVLRSSFCIG